MISLTNIIKVQSVKWIFTFFETLYVWNYKKNPDKARPDKTRQDKTKRYPDKKVSPGLKNTVHVSVNRANDGSGNYLLYIRCKANN